MLGPHPCNLHPCRYELHAQYALVVTRTARIDRGKKGNKVNPEQILTKLFDNAAQRALVLERLIAPSRAAANAMLDAKMNRTADPLAQILFELDAIDAEILTLRQENPTAFADALMTILARRPR